MEAVVVASVLAGGSLLFADVADGTAVDTDSSSLVVVAMASCVSTALPVVEVSTTGLPVEASVLGETLSLEVTDATSVDDCVSSLTLDVLLSVVGVVSSADCPVVELLGEVVIPAATSLVVVSVAELGKSVTASPAIKTDDSEVELAPSSDVVDEAISVEVESTESLAVAN